MTKLEKELLKDKLLYTRRENLKDFIISLVCLIVIIPFLIVFNIYVDEYLYVIIQQELASTYLYMVIIGAYICLALDLLLMILSIRYLVIDNKKIKEFNNLNNNDIKQ